MGERRGGGGGERGGKPSQVKIQGHELPIDGPDHTTRLKDLVKSNSRLITPN